MRHSSPASGCSTALARRSQVHSGLCCWPSSSEHLAELQAPKKQLDIKAVFDRKKPGWGGKSSLLKHRGAPPGFPAEQEHTDFLLDPSLE